MIERGAIELRDVWKGFRSYHAHSLKETLVRLAQRRPLMERWDVLKALSLRVEPGERLGIIGKNGAGKSTLFRVISGIYRADRGTVAVGGRVSPLIEITAGLVPDLNADENIRLNAAFLGLDGREIERRMSTIIELAGITEFRQTPARYYSSGMQARLGFAIAVQVDADVLLVDEVLAVGDVAFQQRCWEVMREMSARGTTIVLVSHDPPSIARFCSRVVTLDAGALVQEGA